MKFLLKIIHDVKCFVKVGQDLQFPINNPIRNGAPDERVS